jgi:hypothetical protein
MAQEVLLLVMRFSPALGANPGEDGMVTGDRESALLLRDVPRNQRNRHIDVDQQTARFTKDVIVAIGPGIISARLIRKRQFLDHSVLGEQVQRSIDGAIGDPGVALAHTLENLAGSQVAVSLLHDQADRLPLCCLTKRRFHRRAASLDQQNAS